MNEQVTRIAVPLPSTLFNSKRIAEVDLPLTCYVPAITIWYVGIPIILWVSTFANMGFAFHRSWLFCITSAALGMGSVISSLQLGARLIFGDAQIIVGSDGIIDTRYGSTLYKWNAFKSAQRISFKGKLFGVDLIYRQRRQYPLPLLGTLVATGLPFRRYESMTVELKSVMDREVVASTIKFLVEGIVLIRLIPASCRGPAS